MAEIDPAHILFRDDAPVSASDPGTVEQVPTAPGSADTASVAATLFDSEVPAVADADIHGAMDKLDRLADVLRAHGDIRRADDLASARDVLVAEASEHGIPAEELSQIMAHVHGAAGTLTPMTPEQLADGRVKAMRELSDVPPEDLQAAQALIHSMEKRIPGLSWQLEASGLGNDVAFIRCVVREARRRSGR